MPNVHPPAELDQPLARPEAEKLAWHLYATDSPAVIELLILAHNPDADPLKRRAADLALEWFDPAALLPRRPSDDTEWKPIRLLKVAMQAGDMQVRIAVGDELITMLKPANVWATAGGR